MEEDGLIDHTLSRISNSNSTSSATTMDEEWLGTLHRDLRIGTDVCAALDRTATRGGSAAFRALLISRPLVSSTALRARQETLRALEGRMTDFKDDEKWQALKEREADALWLIGAKSDEAVRALYDETLIDPWPLSILSRFSPAALVAWNVYRVAMIPVMGLLAPVFYVVVPYLVVLRQSDNPPSFIDFCGKLLAGLLRAPNLETLVTPQQKWAAIAVHLFSLAVSAFAYLSGILGSLQHARSLIERHRVLRVRMARAREFVEAAEKLHDALWRPELGEAFGMRPHGTGQCSGFGCGFVESTKIKTGGHIQRALEHGAKLRDYARFIPERAEEALRSVYELDALVSVLKARRDHSMSWVEFLEDEQPQLRLEGLAHPCLPPADVKRNDVSLGDGSGQKKHMILTGPNAGGKSTLMKAMLCAALMAQTLTIAPCSTAAAMTPFDMLGSHLNVADRTGHESMFEAEMHRMASVLSECEDTKKRLLAIDELFSSTNVVEGTSAAAACARRLGKRPGTLSVISTHFSLVAKQVNGDKGDEANFACCSMPVKRTSSMGIEFPYKLTEGSSTQYIALELMAKSGCGAFDAELVADALRIKRSLVQRLKADAVNSNKSNLPEQHRPS